MVSGDVTVAVALDRVDNGKHFMHSEQELKRTLPSCTLSTGKKRWRKQSYFQNKADDLRIDRKVE